MYYYGINKLYIKLVIETSLISICLLILGVVGYCCTW